MKKFLLSSVLTAGLLSAFAQNVSVYRTGTGAAALNSAATPVFIEEYSPSGTLARSIALPTAVSGSNRMVLASGTATSEGLLTRTVDGTALIATGYDAAEGTISITGSTGATINRTVAVIKADGSIDASAHYTDFSSGSNPRAATSVDGTSFWMTGGAGAVRYAPATATTSTQLNTTPTNIRQVNIFSGNLYYSTGSGTGGIYQVGTGLPGTNGQTVTPVVTAVGSSPYQFVLNTAGTILYIADDRAVASGGGVQKYTYNGTAWSLSYTLSTGTLGVRGVAVDFSGANPVIYATTTETSANKLITITDVSSASAATVIATAAANTVFRGVALSPQVAVVGLRFISFSGSNVNNTYLLKWKTANEENLVSLTIQKSTDGVHFTDVAVQAPHNNAGAAYQYPYTGADKTGVYFRIKGTEISGRSFYSDIIKADLKAGNTLQVSPSFAVSSVTVSYGKHTATADMAVINAAGAAVIRKKVAADTESEIIAVSTLPAGVYFIKYSCDNLVQTARFVKQ